MVKEGEKREMEEKEGGGGRERKRGRINSLKFPDPLDHLSVLVIAEVVVVSASVPRVEGVVSNDVEPFLGQFTLFVADQNLVEVLIVTKGHRHLAQATVGLIHTMLGTAGW